MEKINKEIVLKKIETITELFKNKFISFEQYIEYFKSQEFSK